MILSASHFFLFVDSKYYVNEPTIESIEWKFAFKGKKNIHFKIENSIQLKDTRNDQTKFSNFIVIDSKRVSFFIQVIWHSSY